MSNQNSTFDVGKNVAKLRGECGYSLEQVVSAMKDLGYNWNRTTLFNIEHNLRRLQFQEAYDLLTCLKLDPMKDLVLLCRKDNPSLSVLADSKRTEYARKLIKAWNEYVKASEMYEETIRYDKEHQYITPEWEKLSRDYFDMLDEEFRKSVNSAQADARWGETYLHDFPIPPASAHDGDGHNDTSSMPPQDELKDQ